MSRDISPKKNIELLIEAFRGTRSARNSHRQSLRLPITIESGLAAIQARWPDLHSPNVSEPVFILSAGWRSGSTFLQRWVMTEKNTMLWGEPYRHAGLIESLARPMAAFTDTWPDDKFFIDRHDRDEDLSRTWVANLYPGMEALMNAHIGYLEKLFKEPALARGRNRWGLKAVTLDIAHACYLKWLFPKAKFLFIYRNPYDAYASYRSWRDWYKSWPAEPVFTASRYGALWRELSSDFVENYGKVGGLLLRYEELSGRTTKMRLEEYLGFRMPEAASLARIPDTSAELASAQHQSHWVPKLEVFLLKRQVEPLSLRLGYASPT